MKRLWACCILAVVMTAGAAGEAAQAVDVEAALRFKRLSIAEEEVARLQQSLFDNNGRLLPYDIYRIAELAPQRWPTILASRLLYPSSRAPGLFLRQRDERIKLSILREFRFRAVPALGSLYAAVLQRETAAPVVHTTLRDFFHRDPEAAAEHAVRLSVATASNAHPASDQTQVRRQVLAMLQGYRGVDDRSTITAMRFAIAEDEPLLCLSALRGLPAGRHPGLAAIAIERVLPQVQSGERSMAWSILQAALRRCALTAEHPLSQRLVKLALAEPTDLTYAVVAALAAGRIEHGAQPWEQWRALARRSERVSLRLAINDMLIMAGQDIVEMPGFDLRAHRQWRARMHQRRPATRD